MSPDRKNYLCFIVVYFINQPDIENQLQKNFMIYVQEQATNIFNPVFKKEGYDGFSFWKRIYDIEKWFKKMLMNFVEKDSNCQYWLQTRSGFFENYLEWIFEKTWKASENRKLLESGKLLIGT